MFDNIAAISSGGLINQAISIIRVTGPDSFSIVKKIFSGKIGADKTITYGWIQDQDTLIDEVLVLWFQGSKNFIGQDTVEINAHGGIVNTNLILELLLANGCRLANPGEFSLRAFLNGKIDLIKAEAINDLIHAQTKTQALKSVGKFNNKTSQLLKDLISQLENLIGHCETNIDYPEIDDLETLTEVTLAPKLRQLSTKLGQIASASENARAIFDGIKVAIVGKPNVGKSSLLNALLNETRAIVTNIAGTTRDIVQGKWQMDGLLFQLSDTAGIRKSSDIVEQIGVEKSLETIATSDVVLHLIDPLQVWNEIDEKIFQSSNGKKYFLVVNKSDLLNEALEPKKIYISALNQDLTQLETALKEAYQNSFEITDDEVVNNQRQIALIKSAQIALEQALIGLENGFGPDVVIIDIRQAWEDLYNIIGQSSNEVLLDAMFSHFCLGK